MDRSEEARIHREYLKIVKKLQAGTYKEPEQLELPFAEFSASVKAPAEDSETCQKRNRGALGMPRMPKGDSGRDNHLRPGGKYRSRRRGA